MAFILSMIISATIFGACSNSAQASSVRVTDTTIARTNAVIENIEKLDNESFDFPSYIDTDFSAVRDINAKRRREKFYGAKEAPSKYNEQIKKYDDLYLSCADISNKNAQIDGKCDEIKALTARSKELRAQIRANKSTINAETYNDINSQCFVVRRSVERVNYTSRSVKTAVKCAKIRDGEANIEQTAAKYAVISKKMDRRIENLDDVITDLKKLNKKMECALGIESEVSAEFEATAPRIFTFEIRRGGREIRNGDGYNYESTTTGAPVLKRLPYFGTLPFAV